MRKVAVYETCQKERLLYEGIFHCFANNSEEVGDGWASFPVAVIEKDDGCIESVWADRVRFLEKA